MENNKNESKILDASGVHQYTVKFNSERGKERDITVCSGSGDCLYELEGFLPADGKYASFDREGIVSDSFSQNSLMAAMCNEDSVVIKNDGSVLYMFYIGTSGRMKMSMNMNMLFLEGFDDA